MDISCKSRKGMTPKSQSGEVMLVVATPLNLIIMASSVKLL